MRRTRILLLVAATLVGAVVGTVYVTALMSPTTLEAQRRGIAGAEVYADSEMRCLVIRTRSGVADRDERVAVSCVRR